jgi:hypothetical protein
VKYRVGRLKKPLEGADAKNGVLFKVADLGVPDKTGKANWAFNHVLFPRPGLTLRRHQGRHDPERYTHGGLSLAECMIPLVVLGPKEKFEPPFDLVDIRFEGALAEGQPLTIVVTARAKAALTEEVLFQLRVDAGLDDIQPRKEVFTGAEHEYRVHWTPKIATPGPDEQKAGKVVKQVTAVASYLWKHRTVRTSVHGQVEIQLDPSRIRRRLAVTGRPPDVLVLDVATGMVVRRLKGHKGRVHALSYSPDGRRLLTAGEDGMVWVWDAATGQEQQTLHENGPEVFAAVFHPDGRRIATAGRELPLMSESNG